MSKYMDTDTDFKKKYGRSKAFFFLHFDDIQHLRKRLSAEKVAKIYGGIIGKGSIYQYERECNPKRCTQKVTNKE